MKKHPLRISAGITAMLAVSGCSTLGIHVGKPPPPPTLQTLAGKTQTLPPDPPIKDAERLARENYQKFLEQPGLDPKLAAEASRRLGDLKLEAGESADLANDSTKPAGADTAATQASVAQSTPAPSTQNPSTQTQAIDPLRASTYAPAVQQYQSLLSQYPDYAHNDLVLYQMARAQESGGDPLAALATLDQLVAKSPHTPLMDEVQFRRGEILFSRERYAEAEVAYAEVLKIEEAKPGPFAEQALYKHGWARFKQDRFEEGLDSFFKLLDGRLAKTPATAIDQQLDAQSRPVRELIDDTLHVSALSFSFLEGEKSLRQQLHDRSEPSYGHLLYQSLAGLYMEQKRYTDAAGVLMGFVQSHPTHPRAPYLHMQAVAFLERGKFPSEALAARDSFVKRFGLEEPYWAAQPGAVPAGTPPAAAFASITGDQANHAVVAFLRDSVWMLAQQAHADAQLPRQSAAEREQNYRLAAERYRRYLDYFPADAQAPKVQFLLGEVQFERADYPAAVAAYEASAYNYPKHERSAESGYAALVAYQKHEPTLNGDEKAGWHRRLVDAELRFADRYPDDARAMAVRVNAAEGLLAAGALPEAIAAARPATFATAQAGSTATLATAEQRRAAWMVIGQGSFDTQDFAQAETAFQEVQQLDKSSGHKDPELSERIAASIYRQGEQARAAGKPEQAAANFLRVAQAAPDSKIRVTADYDAAQAYLAAGQTAAAIPVLLAFRDQHPDNTLVPAVTASLALAYVKTNDTAAAAREFERIADTQTNPPAERQEALQQAIKLHAARHDDLAEARTLSLFVKRYPEAFDASMEARQRLIDIATQRKEQTARLAWSKDLIAYDAGSPARNDRSRYLAAHATLNLAEPARDEFLAIPLSVPLKTSFKAKKTSMEAALAVYGKAADYGVADVTTNATYQIGELYNHLAQALNKSERPKNLDPQALEQYELLIQEQSFPFEEKAIELHEANVKRVKDGIYDEWVRSSYATLAKLVPGRYAREDREEAYVDAIR